MILTGSEIEREWANGRITIDPFIPEQVNPNSYNFRLGKKLRVYRDMPLDTRSQNDFDEVEIPDEGYVLEPGKLYLAHTIEVLGSEHYVPTFAARSSVARLGLFINLSASLGDIGYVGQWTLQLYTMNPVRVYSGINIGQMMWWRPQGDIVLYKGKYQGSSGPRTSDIHVDFHKHFARQRFPGLGASIDVTATGPKFAALAECSRNFRVPPAFCVPAGEFADALTDEQNAALTEAFADLRATVGAFFPDSMAQIQKIASEIRLPDQTRLLLKSRLTDVFGDIDTLEFAVRSSGLDEDTSSSSLAGVHQSLLGVRGADAVADAVEECWRSYYATPAVAARVRKGDFDPLPRLAVIVQALVRPELAGVAFSEPVGAGGNAGTSTTEVVIEYVPGLADRLVAGVAVPQRVTSADLPSSDGPEGQVMTQVVELVRALRNRYGHDVDVEWAADARGVHLVQVRPLTAARQQPSGSDEPCIRAYRLYFDELPTSLHLGESAGVYASYVAKRGPAYRLAAEHGIPVGAGWVIQFNGRGLHDPASVNRLRETLAAGDSEECVLDFGDTLRQIVVPKEEVIEQFVRTIGCGPESSTLHTVIVRDYLRGELGVISRRAGDGLIVEFTAEGLMALNRGTAGAQTIVVRDVAAGFDAPENVTAADAVLLPHLPELTAFTTAMQDRHGPVTLEWVYQAGRLYFIDYSLLGQDEMTVASGAVQISAGTASGPLLHLTEDTLLARLSIGPAVSVDKSQDVSEHEGLAQILERVKAMGDKPIVHATRPYAVLSVLIGHVAGFVFEEGSTLGHLAILLREAGVPAVAVPGITGPGEAVISEGTVVVTSGKGE